MKNTSSVLIGANIAFIVSFLLVFTFNLFASSVYAVKTNTKNIMYLAQRFKRDISMLPEDNFTTTATNDISTKLQQLLKQYHEYKIQYYYRKRQYWATTKVGDLLFKNHIKRHYNKKDRTFLIYVWRKWIPWLKSRHLSHQPEHVFLEECSVKNCKVSHQLSHMPIADVVVVHVQEGILPPSWKRNPSQRWVFLSDESPKNIFSTAIIKPRLVDWSNVFNWTMTYRTDSDVPIPYGRTLPLVPISPNEIQDSIIEYIPYWSTKRRDVLLAILISSCHVKKRMNYIKDLQEHISVDVYGKCSHNNKNSCPGRYMNDCAVLNNYIFYLAFENSGCRQYITEKTFHHSFAKGAIPIIMGPPRKDCYKLLPPFSFIHTADFASPKALSEFIRRISVSDDGLLIYHQWRRFFKIVNEHGYSGTNSSAICRLCEALNYNDDKSKVYSEDDLKLFLQFNLLCNY